MLVLILVGLESWLGDDDIIMFIGILYFGLFKVKKLYLLINESIIFFLEKVYFKEFKNIFVEVYVN